MVRRRLAGLVAVLVGLVGLAGCSVPASVRPGMDQAAVTSVAGRPTSTYPLPDGGVRWQYSGQPFSQWVWNIDLDRAGRVVQTEQVMSDAAFARIRIDQDTQADVLRTFGAPAEVKVFALRDETAWMYRYFTYGAFYAAMYVSFDRAGRVTRVESGLDPWTLGGNDSRH
jgi:hypothetical protein